jgi:hypothetical protein
MSWTYWIVFGHIDARRKPAKRLSMLQIFKDLPEPIDLELDPANRTVYWTDRGDPPLGNTVNPAPLDVAAGDAPRVLLDGLQEAIGRLLDLTNRHMFFTDLGGSPYAAAIYGADLRLILEDQGISSASLTLSLSTEPPQGFLQRRQVG